MAKNKNRRQSSRQNRSPQAERAREQTERSSTEAQESPISMPQGGPAGAARKRQKRFGHN